MSESDKKEPKKTKKRTPKGERYLTEPRPMDSTVSQTKKNPKKQKKSDKKEPKKTKKRSEIPDGAQTHGQHGDEVPEPVEHRHLLERLHVGVGGLRHGAHAKCPLRQEPDPAECRV